MQRNRKSIYLYEELSLPKEMFWMHTLLDVLLVGLWQIRLLNRVLSLVKFAGMMPEIENPERITQRIMRTIGTQSKIDLWSQLTAYVDTVFVRYAFSFASLVLILFFVLEQSIDSQSNNAVDKKIELAQASILNTRAISNNYLMKKKSNGQAFSRYTYYKQNANHY
ncbi:MAG: hypothetical protein U5K54_16890 [Cytophagales bacterium]|nr:hypothetical protein [Cytophagales bacterium]